MADLSEEETTKYTDFYNKVLEEGDHDREGLNFQGFSKLLVMCGHRLPTAETRFMFLKTDKNDDGKISLDEFLDVASNVDPTDPADSLAADLRNKFSEHDLDKDGYVSLDEVRTLLGSGDRTIDDEWVKGFMTDWDTDGDGRLNFEEFVNLYVFSNLTDNDEHEEGEEIEITGEEEKKALMKKDILVSADKIRMSCYENNFVKLGRISVEELKLVLHGVKMQLAEEQLGATLELLDRENYGALNFEEFVSIFEDIPADKFVAKGATVEKGDGGNQQKQEEELEEHHEEMKKEEGRILEKRKGNVDGDYEEDNNLTTVMRKDDERGDKEEIFKPDKDRNDKGHKKRHSLLEQMRREEEAKIVEARRKESTEGYQEEENVVTKMKANFETKRKDHYVCSDDGAKAECRGVGVKAMMARFESKAK